MMKMMKVSIFIFALLLSTTVSAQKKEQKTIDKSRYTVNPEPYAEQRKVDRSRYVAGASMITSVGLRKGCTGVLAFTGYERTVGNSLKNGYFFSGEARAKAGFLSDVGSRERLNYHAQYGGLSLLVRPNLEIMEEMFVFLEGEWGLMYEYVHTKVKNADTDVRKSVSNIVPQWGGKAGFRTKGISLFAGIFYFNHTKAVNHLIPKDLKIVDSDEGLGGEIGFAIYF